MSDETSASDKEDLLILRLGVGGVVSIVLSLIVLAVAVAVLVSANLNVMNWLE